MSEPKAVRMWAVVTPSNNLTGCVSLKRKYAIKQFVDMAILLSKDHPALWGLFRRKGYRCIPVTVTPDPTPKEKE